MKKQKKEKKIPLRGFSLRRYVVTLYAVTRFTNKPLLGTENARGKISEHMSSPNGSYCLYIGIC